MKRMLRSFFLIGILLLTFLNTSLVKGKSNNRRVIYTAITNISPTSFIDPEFDPDYGYAFCENCTNFDFILDCEILNPRIRKLTLYFPDSTGLLPNVTASFEDTNYTLALYYPPGLPVVTKRIYDPGITRVKGNYRVKILTQNLTSLPFGEYTFVISGYYRFSFVVISETIMTISDNGTSIIYGSLPFPDVTRQKRNLVFIHIGLVLAFVFVLIPKRKRKP